MKLCHCGSCLLRRTTLDPACFVVFSQGAWECARLVAFRWPCWRLRAALLWSLRLPPPCGLCASPSTAAGPMMSCGVVEVLEEGAAEGLCGTAGQHRHTKRTRGACRFVALLWTASTRKHTTGAVKWFVSIELLLFSKTQSNQQKPKFGQITFFCCSVVLSHWSAQLSPSTTTSTQHRQTQTAKQQKPLSPPTQQQRRGDRHDLMQQQRRSPPKHRAA